TPGVGPCGERTQRLQETLPDGCQQIALAFVTDEAGSSQLPEARIEQARVRLGRPLKRTKRHGRPLPKLPEDSQRAPATQEVEDHHDRPASVRATNRATYLRP